MSRGVRIRTAAKTAKLGRIRGAGGAPPTATKNAPAGRKLMTEHAREAAERGGWYKIDILMGGRPKAEAASGETCTQTP